MTPPTPPLPPGALAGPPKLPLPQALSPPLEASAEATCNSAMERPKSERAAFVRDACGQDDALQQRVRELLAAHEATEGPDSAPGSSSPAIEQELARLKPEESGERIGSYKLLQPIGEGGFGVVWMADQEYPVRRRVALKVIKLGMDTKEVIARFEQERQALAMMDHPNIARVIDAGATQFGRPYFVMELVRGVKITEYCDSEGLTTPERIQLFIAVCQAVQHAHQKGIVHRDLKPSNILVTINDGEAVPKVIDFGVAKATQGRLTDGTLFTQFEQMIGTPLYMSPEQAEMTSLDVDTRSDIYSLGVLLYELLTGHTPIDSLTMAHAGMDEIRRMIRELDPPRPSMRVRTLNPAELTSAAKRRRTDPARLPATLRGDIDWIVMKCLEKDRKRRYDTANGLALDLQRHLKNEVITARPPTAGYLLGKLVRRHRNAFAAAATIFLVVLFGFVVSAWQAVRAIRADRRSTAALDELRATAPAFAEQARALAAKEQFGEAIAKLDYALKLTPDAAEYLVAKGDLLQCQLKLAEAAAIYRQASRVSPGFSRAESSAKLCDELLAAPATDQGKLTRESLAKLHLAMQQQQRPAAELMPLARLLGEEKKLVVEYWLARLKDLPISAEKPLEQRLSVRDDGLLALDLSGTKVDDLAQLAGMPLGLLRLSGCKQLTNFAPLHELRSLTTLNLAETDIADLSLLSGLPLESLDLTGTRTFDITALRGMKLKALFLRNTRVADLSPIAGMPLKVFDSTATPATDYSPLADAPLESCFIQNSPIRDLSFLRNSPVKELALFDSNEARGYSVLASLKSLNLLVLPRSFRELPEEELAAIEALRNHASLRNIDTADGRKHQWIIGTARSKDDFWKGWDTERGITRALHARGIEFEFFPVSSGTYRLVIKSRTFSDLSIFKGAPIAELVLDETAVADLKPLADLPLVLLSLDKTSVSDLTPIGSMALKSLSLRETPVTDLSVLRSAPLSNALENLWLYRTKVTDFSPVAVCSSLVVFDATQTALPDLEAVRGRKLREIYFASTSVRDIGPLAGMPLDRAFFDSCDVIDVSPLLNCPTLRDILLPRAAKNVLVLQSLPRVERVSYDYDGKVTGPSMSAAQFWSENERGGLTAEIVPILSDSSVQKPGDTLLALKVAALQVWFGRNAEHAAFCARMITSAEMAGATESTRERAVKQWCFRPSDDVAMLDRVLALARKAARSDAKDLQVWYQQTLGMAEFRAGNDAAAEAAFRQAEQLAETQPELQQFIRTPSRFFRSMILFRNGKEEEAEKLFRTTEAEMQPVPEKGEQLLPLRVTQDELLCWLAHREAKALLSKARPIR
jgi:serine/threonine protein kinase/Leucine-rich repeat (LRR) protein/Flp pilus assembly protein TadD